MYQICKRNGGALVWFYIMVLILKLTKLT
jgi:hypothetical protein